MAKSDGEWVKCPRCSGKGEVASSNGGKTTCPSCAGQGSTWKK